MTRTKRHTPAANGCRLELIEGKYGNGTPFHAFIVLTDTAFKALERDRKKRTVHLEDYGIILSQGLDRPSEQEIEEIQALFQKEFLK